MGTAAIITANLTMNFEAEIRWGFRALVLALIACGAIVYLRDDVFTSQGIEPWGLNPGVGQREDVLNPSLCRRQYSPSFWPFG